MSKAYKCDRCGEFYEFSDKIDRMTIKGDGIWAIKVYGRLNPVMELDELELCPNCANSFGNWLTDTKECDDE